MDCCTVSPKVAALIVLTKLDKTPVAVNLESVKYVESVPDTVVFFMNGDSIIVRESLEDFVEKSNSLKARLYRASLDREEGVVD